MRILFSILPLLTLAVLISKVQAQYKPSWDSLDTRPLPAWYDKAKIGIFLHWGVFSVPSFGSEWFWFSWKGDNSEGHKAFMEKNYPPNFTYQDFAKEFTAEFFEPKDWAELFVKSGAKYVVLTTKHHEGYTLWPSKYSYSWNSQDVGPHRDLLGDLAAEVREQGLHLGVYHSLLEWFHPLYLQDKANQFSTSDFPISKVIPELKELVNNYKPELIWSDGNWEGNDTYWQSLDFLAWLYNESPVKDFIVTNDRWGSNTQCSHGDYLTCADKFNPGHVLPKKWENAMSLDKESWGYRRQAKSTDILTIHELLQTITETISCGGNILINVGPTKEGTISPVFQERLLQLGTWLGINGEALYESDPWSVQNDTLTSGVWYTTKDPVVYAIVLDWPENNVLSLASVGKLFGSTETKVTLLGNVDKKILWKINGKNVDFTFPDKATVVGESAWVLKIEAPSALDDRFFYKLQN